MKYCSKCGNKMEDNMIFCQKCGTKFVEILNNNPSDIDMKLAQIKKYNLVLDSQSITWEYLRADGERAGNICAKQDKLCEELVALIKEILENTTNENKDFIEREVYTFVLNMGILMCNEGEKLFSDYTGFKELFDLGNSLVKSGQLNPKTFLDQMVDVDVIYKATAGFQGLHSSRIKAVLAEDIIASNREYQDLTIQLAQAFNKMWFACVKRYADFFACPGPGMIDQNWDCYLTILKGLPISAIETLDESGWMLALDWEEKQHDGAQYKRVFLQNREQYRNELRVAEQERIDIEYWRSHPEQYEAFERNNVRIAEIRTDINAVENDISIIENDLRSLQETKADVEKNITGKQQKIDKLKDRIFGKKKAEETINALYEEIKNLTIELTNAQNEIGIVAAPLNEKRDTLSNLEAEVHHLQEENTRLRNSR